MLPPWKEIHYLSAWKYAFFLENNRFSQPLKKHKKLATRLRIFAILVFRKMEHWTKICTKYNFPQLRPCKSGLPRTCIWLKFKVKSYFYESCETAFLYTRAAKRLYLVLKSAFPREGSRSGQRRFLSWPQIPMVICLIYLLAKMQIRFKTVDVVEGSFFRLCYNTLKKSTLRIRLEL